MAALDKPKRYRSQLQKQIYDAPTAWNQADENLESKWVQELSFTFLGAKTLMGGWPEKKVTCSYWERARAWVFTRPCEARQEVPSLAGSRTRSRFLHASHPADGLSSQRNKIKTLHMLGSCHVLLGIDFVSNQYLGMCKGCAKTGHVKKNHQRPTPLHQGMKPG